MGRGRADIPAVKYTAERRWAERKLGSANASCAVAGAGIERGRADPSWSARRYETRSQMSMSAYWLAKPGIAVNASPFFGIQKSAASLSALASSPRRSVAFG